ncbi:Putative zn(2)Cys(6) fungal-type DNA-binding domain-containing protein [Colletotrichum destructivum]|uniref:Zn(2)Cys(6) fungal-type DNA-binding domain-containing protein n=1 Tax=Colletotrichum destructivum TaxID=34406 RepID=A0AAX4IZ93_9PEZI|nr:Putative zn(2)Cys(6) fungal-type DNA-binding domain-containing protein [Colletotrichum destructivum]
MDSVSPVAYSTDTKTRRLRNSCDLCTRSKLKCDQMKPSCNRCVRRGQGCVYSQVRKAGRPPKTPNKLQGADWKIRLDKGGKNLSFYTSSPRDSSTPGSTTWPIHATASVSSDSRTPSPSTGEGMEDRMMGYFDNCSWDSETLLSTLLDAENGWSPTYDSTALDFHDGRNHGIDSFHHVNTNFPSHPDLQHSLLNQDIRAWIGHQHVQSMNPCFPDSLQESLMSYSTTMMPGKEQLGAYESGLTGHLEPFGNGKCNMDSERTPRSYHGL